MISEDVVNEIISSFLLETDYYLVDLKINSNNQITVEIDSFNGVSIDFCSQLSKHIENQMDRDLEDYELEVGSAGLTEPFKVIKQYEKNIGNEVEILTKTGIKYKGILVEVDETSCSIELEKKEKKEGSKRKINTIEKLTFLFEEIKTTKYIIRFK
jgi:ribosome maturation factor RimP